jgi:TonB-linked SusC/RagA family outer membrane protein
MESSDYLAQGISASRRYFISDQLPYLFAGGTTGWTNNGSVSIDSRLNYFGRVMYNFKETYLLQFSLRRDGSSRFSKESGRWGTFPSILAGWKISNENFWKNNVKFINFLKLKASYGRMGNDQVSSFQYLASYAYGTGMVFGSGVYSTGLVQSGNPNPFITWEVANIINLGFESALLNNKVTFNTDFFYQRRSNILIKRNASVPAYTGIVLPDENFGIVDNKGFEMELGYNDRKGDFSYGINGNIAFARNSIVEFDEPARNVPWQVQTGHSQGTLLLYKSAGIFRDVDQVNSLPHVSGARPGDIIIEDYDKNGIINNDDRIYFDMTADPRLTYAVTLNLSYKNWNLSSMIQGVGTNMRNIYSNSKGLLGNYFAYEAEDRWTVDNIDATKPRAYQREEEYWTTQYATDYNYMKGGYARLKNLQLSYSIPKRLLNVVMLKDAQLYFSGENLLLIYSQNKIFDPEITSESYYPPMKVYALGIKVAF